MTDVIIGIIIFCLTGSVLFATVEMTKEGIKDKEGVEIACGVATTLLIIAMCALILWTIVTCTHICPKCKHVSFDEKYCIKCGEQLTHEARRCPECNEVADENASYCYNCGQQLQDN